MALRLSGPQIDDELRISSLAKLEYLLVFAFKNATRIT